MIEVRVPLEGRESWYVTKVELIDHATGVREAIVEQAVEHPHGWSDIITRRTTTAVAEEIKRLEIRLEGMRLAQKVVEDWVERGIAPDRAKP